ncbi:MAG: protein phosphatase 2C domain-containing protein [Acidobacteria bacterium]|nr:protein phosphatase 2C domain-containing protein [Acidobacteriota bacterium]
MDRLTWTCATATGTRNRNEDTFRWRHAPSLALDGDHPVAVVCDGLGGHAHGEIASNTAAEAFMQEYLTGSPAGATVPERLFAAVHAANDAIGELCQQNPKLWGMGTTLTAAAVTTEGLWRISVGDSPLRVWSRRNGELRQLSKRHNVADHPHRLSSALQGWEIPEIDAPVHAAPLGEGDAVILASDGLDTLSTETISAIAAMDAAHTGSNLAWSLIEAVIAAGRKKQDNTTAACLRMPEDTGHGPDTIRAVRGAEESEVTIGGQPLDWRASLAVRNHSPSGIEWGYNGSGPAQLALAILLTLTNAETAVSCYHQFKDEMIARIDEPQWALPLRDVRRWLKETSATDATV